MEELTRREVRYWLFRFGTEARGDAKANGAPPGLKAHFEEQMDDLNIRFLNKKDFWDNFAKKWDVDEDDYWSVVPSKFSVWDEWEAVLRQVAPVLPGLEHLEEVIEEE